MAPMRLIRHLLYPGWLSRRAFPAASMRRIESAIADSEAQHRGEIRFAVETTLDPAALLQGRTARERAIEVFGELRIWDTEENNGVLVYLLLADRDVEIVADRGIHRGVGDAGWEAICREMERRFRLGQFESGVLWGVQAIGKHLATAFPRHPENANELADRPVRF